MELDEVWRAIDQQRLELADLMETFSDVDWETPSLCEGWRVRDVAAHLTLAHTGARQATLDVLRAGLSFNRMIHDTAVRRARLPVEEYPALLRAMVGSRRRAPVVSPLEPLVDAIVHAQDMLLPLGRQHAVPPTAAAAAAERVWTMGFPFWAQRRLRGVMLEATDVEWNAGHGEGVQGPAQDLLLLLTGRRTAALPRLRGHGVAELSARWA